MLQGKRVAVTGGGGFIGSHLVGRLAGGNEVLALDDLTVGRLQNLAGVRDRVTVVKGSILDPRALRRAFADADLVFHLAALTSVPGSLEDPLAYAEANVLGTVKVLTAAAEAGADRVVFASSCAVYGRDPPPLAEGAPPDPLSPYAVSKLASEHFCRSLSGPGRPETTSLRLFNVYGPRQSPESPYASVVARFVRGIVAGKPLTLHGDGRQTRDFVYVSDVAEAFDRAATARAAAGGVFNVGSGRETSILDLIAALGSIEDVSVKVRRTRPRPKDVRNSRADTTLATKVLGFRASTRLEEGLRRTLEAARASPS